MHHTLGTAGQAERPGQAKFWELQPAPGEHNLRL